MKIRTAVKIRTAAVGVLLLTTAACGTSVQDASTPAAAIATVDNCGRTLEFGSVPERVVSLSPSQTELLVQLGAADAMVGQAQTDTSPLSADVAERVADVPVLSTDSPPGREVLLEVAPDFVVAPTEYEFTAEQGFASIDQLRQAGANAYVATGGCAERRTTATVDDLFTDITDLGIVFDERDRATELVEDGRRRLDAVAADGADRPARTVAQVYVEGTSLSVIGAGVEADIVARAGGENVFRPDESMFDSFFSATVGPEELAARNPDALVFAVSGDAHREATLAYLRATFPDMTAVQENRLIAVPGADMFPGTLGNIGAVETIARGIG
ncbi:iron complex transport system substrate-binding protein [Rhodococcus triatomae]|uniref:Iron complex transport system substrate-binding protein n=1 Tax=Rhodococcus triatomae TaxID=300028 RepID=A0A1G8J3U9_9NOCA|nr:ABC transporter substrate-binding protein [Rhodococcus triatomae]SDI25791.1 iron complex transport system substrate-binding protein [Rhodococcus triatomae]